MDNTITHSPIRGFFKASASGAFNGGLMMGIFYAVTQAAALVGFLAPTSVPVLSVFLASAAVATLATGLFSGVMSLKDRLSESPSSAHAERRGRGVVVPVPVSAMTTSPTIPVSTSMTSLPDTATETTTTPTRTWVAGTGRTTDTSGRIQQILNNGAIGDKDRASEILAAREAASGELSRSA
ncbi:MAG: hypothetical protein ACOYNL_09985 [Rickettsiales bacterium]